VRFDVEGVRLGSRCIALIEALTLRGECVIRITREILETRKIDGVAERPCGHEGKDQGVVEVVLSSPHLIGDVLELQLLLFRDDGFSDQFIDRRSTEWRWLVSDSFVSDGHDRSSRLRHSTLQLQGGTLNWTTKSLRNLLGAGVEVCPLIVGQRKSCDGCTHGYLFSLG
jgi:hypothetical protein